MISLSEAQILAWVTPLLWPFLRALALFSSLPVLGTRTVPARVRIGLSAFVALAAQPTLPVAVAVPLDSPVAFMLVLQQVLIGVALGFSVRVVFAAVEFAGEVIGLQMGLNFAGFFDPLSASSGTASSRFFGTLVAWLFVVGGGHLLVIAALVQSFGAFPAGPEPFEFFKTVQPQRWGSEIFSLGLWIALPLIAMLLMVNLVLGLISRVASQINVFSVGFPITLSVGLLGMLMTLPALEQPFTMALERMLSFFR
ncbi:MAG: flagellar biosynthetic protein FliR [Rubrivivax sp.]|nr:flagellar biosynthetic protein FliR [Rubrivivax sp.]MBK8526747.1 flagellar biosynthetic protein FliR [Rubrivivax sp.]